MISLKRNSKKELTPATGLRSRASSFYTPNQPNLFKISQSKFNDFLTCQRCFYLDRVKGLVSPSIPGWTLNETTDLLLKKEFDLCREKQIPHRIFDQYDLNHIVPFMHTEIDKWRDSLHHGLKINFKNTNIILQGGVDDIWLDKTNNKLIVVEYKSQANNKAVNTESYLSNVYHQGYKIQMDFYAYLLTEMGFEVSPVSYFYVCNADRSTTRFDSKIVFMETLVPYKWDSTWIENKVWEMIKLLNSEIIPEGNNSCENCAYSLQRTNLTFMAKDQKGLSKKLFRNSSKWRTYKNRVNIRCHGICEYCNLRKMTSVHHRIESRLDSDYENPNIKDLMGVCEECHDLIHNNQSSSNNSLEFQAESPALSGDNGYSTLDEPPGHWIT